MGKVGSYNDLKYLKYTIGIRLIANSGKTISIKTCFDALLLIQEVAPFQDHYR